MTDKVSWPSVVFTLTVAMKTDREPWEMGNALAGFLQHALEDENPEQVGDIDVDLQDFDVVHRKGGAA